MLPRRGLSGVSLRLLDGGTGDLLTRLPRGQGLFSAADDAWSAVALVRDDAHPLVREAHALFAEAGAQALVTANFACREVHGFAETEVTRLCGVAALLAREAAAARKLTVLGSLPPLLECYRATPMATSGVTRADAVRQYRAMLRGFFSSSTAATGGGVDAVLCETLNSSDEAEAALEALAMEQPDPATRVPALVSFTLKRDGSLYSGETPAAALSRVVHAASATQTTLLAFGFNCTPPDAISRALTSLSLTPSAHAQLAEINCRLMARPNRYGAPDPSWTSLVQPLNEAFDESSIPRWLGEWKSLGVSVFGGCCGVDPPLIKAMAASLEPAVRVR